MIQTTTLITVVLAFSSKTTSCYLSSSSTTTTTSSSSSSSTSSSSSSRCVNLEHQNYHRHSAYNKRLITHPSSTRRCRTSVSSTTMLQQSSSVERHDITTTVSLAWTEFFAPKASSDPSAATTTTTPVLLLHGLLGSKRNFSSLGRMLGIQLDQPRRILGVDLRNHGDSQHAEHMSYVEMAQDVIQFLDSQQIEKIVLVGHSMGGKVAQAMALLYPHRVEGLVVLDIAPVKYLRDQDPHWKVVEDILHAIHDVVESQSMYNTPTEIDKALCPSIPDPALRAFVLTNYDHRKQQWKIPIATLVKQLEHIAGFDLQTKSTTPTFDGDVFIIHGGQSRFVRHAYMDTISSYFPNHMLTTIRGAGHWVHAEAPDDVTALLKRYLDR